MTSMPRLCVPLILAIAATGAWGQGAGPGDSHVAHIFVTANEVDIEVGKLARSKAQSDQVRQFAERMITDHTTAARSAAELTQRLHIRLEPNPTSESLKRGRDATVAKLQTLSGAAFDKAYIDHEVGYHETVLSALDKTLIPGAKNAELKALLVKARPVFEEHLNMAKQLQSALSKSGA